MIVVGIDVSKDWFDAAWRQKDRTCGQRFDYTSAGIKQLLKCAPKEAVFAMEATGTYHARLALGLFEAQRDVSVINPLVIKRYGQMKLSRAKSDPIDARLIMQYGEREPLSLWKPRSEAVQELQQVHGWLHGLIEARTRLLNRQQSQALHVRPNRAVKRDMKAELKRLDRRIAAFERYLTDLVKKTFKKLYDKLLTIPSIGPKTAIELIIITDGFTRFEDVKALSAYVGVCPTTFRSGSSIRGKGHTAKLGNGRIRQLLYMCSWTAKKCNPACVGLSQRLQAAGKPPKAINIAVAHKLLRQAFAVATQNVEFSPEFA